jgi:hypothetical protein
VDVLADQAQLARMYDHPGPFVTVYLDATHSTEAGEREVELRWRDVRRDLAADGVSDRDLEVVEEAIAADAGTPGPHGLVAVAADGELCLADDFPDPPANSRGRFAPLPHLMPFLAQRVVEQPHVVVVADRTGADIIVVGPGGTTARESVQGRRTYPLHRTATVDWSERHFQQRVENNWESNARDVAAEVRAIQARLGVQLVVLAGDVRARHLVADALGEHPGLTVRMVEEGGRAAGSSEEALERAVHDEVLRHVWRERRAVLDRLQQNLGRGVYAVAGVGPVVAALRKAQVDTLVVSDDPSSTLTAWIGERPTDFGTDDAEAAALGVRDPRHDRLDAALVRAAHGIGAGMVVTPGAHRYLPDGIGALLRYDDARTSERSDHDPRRGDPTT